MKYRKLPVEIEAYQVTRELLEGVLFDGKEYPIGLSPLHSSCNKKTRYISVWGGHVTTIHNQKTNVVEGDWIITEPDGIHYYPCKPDIFEKTYQPAKEGVEGAEGALELNITIGSDIIDEESAVIAIMNAMKGLDDNSWTVISPNYR